MSAAMDEAAPGPSREAGEVIDAIDRVESDWHRERPDIDVSSMGIVSRIWRIGRHLERQRKEQLAEFGSDRGTIDVLGMLRRSGPPYRRSSPGSPPAGPAVPGGRDLGLKCATARI